MSLSYTTVTGTFTDGSGNPIPLTGQTAYCQFTPSTAVYDSAIPIITPASPIQAPIIDGSLIGESGGDCQLLATDNSGLSFGGLTGFFYWTVAVYIAGQKVQEFSFFLPSSPGTVDLSELANTSAGGGGGFNSPMTTLGDTLFEDATPAAARLPGNTTVTRKFLRQTGTGTVSAAPAWDTLVAGDIPSTLNGTTFSGHISPAVVSLSQSGGSVAVNAALGNVGRLTLTASGWTISNPTNPVDGQGLVFQLVQDATGNRTVTWDTAYDFGAGGAPTLSTAGNAIDVLGFVYDSGVSKWVYAGGGGGSSASEAWQFHVSDYGAKGDGTLVADGAITSSTNTLACATSTPFASAAHGMAIHVGGAGGGTYAPLITTINTITNSGHVVLTANATSTVSSGIVYFGTDDTAAVQAAVDAAAAYAQANHGYAEVLFDPVMYIIAGNPVLGGATAGNAQVTLPVITDTNEKVTLVFKGTQEQTALSHWLQTIPQASGAILASLNGSGTNDGTRGPAFTVGGPVVGYGGGTSLFSNLCPVVDGVGIMVPYNGTVGGWGFFGCAEAVVKNGGVFAAAVPPTGSSVPSMSSSGNISNQYPVGLQMPDVNNNDNCFVNHYSCEGLCVGLQLSEHSWFTSIQLVYCLAGIQAGSWSGTSMPHTYGGAHASIEICDSAIVGLGATSNVFIDRIDMESCTNSVFDPSGFLQGQIGFGYNGSPSYGPFTISSGSPIRALDLMQHSGPVASPQAPVASGSPWANQYYRDAFITLSATTSISAISIGSTAQKITTGATQQILLPAGKSYTATYTGTLSHTVTLL